MTDNTTTADTTRDLAGNDVSTDHSVKDGAVTPKAKKPKAPKAKKPKAPKAKKPKAPKAKKLPQVGLSPNKAPKAKAEATPKATKAKATAAGGAKKDRSMAAVPVAERRLALVKLLRKMGATGATTARPISALAEKLGYGTYDVYCLVYHKYPLAAQGYVKTVKLEDQRDLCVYLTAKGQKVNPE